MNRPYNKPLPPYINRIEVWGRVGKKPVLRELPSGDSVCNFSVATRGGESGKDVEWHDIVCFDQLAEHAHSYYDTGDHVLVIGEVKTREFRTAEDKQLDRRPRKVREIICRITHLVEKNMGGQSKTSTSPNDSDVEYQAEKSEPATTPADAISTAFQKPAYL